jgi:5'-nucleotidase
MKRFSLLLAAVLITASLAFSQGVEVTLLHTSDSHSHLTQSGAKDFAGYPTQGGISRFAGMVGYLKATEPNPLFFHCGDYSVSDFMFNSYFGVHELQILQGAGCDAMAVGNHEFDLGPDP